MNILPIPCLRDNYAYLVQCPQTNKAAVVDPSEFDPVWCVIQEQQVDLVAILSTHHHWDHVGGNKALLERLPELEVYGFQTDEGRIPGQNRFLMESDQLMIGELKGSIVHNPGHTTGAISYLFEDALFVGDTMFSAGCGRLFEGTPEQMYQSLQKLVQLPGATKVYFGHEYTEANLRFAQTVDPENIHVLERIKAAQALREQGRPTTPSTIEAECLINPFLRCDSSNLQQTLVQHGYSHDGQPASVFSQLRAWKDIF